VFGIIDFTTGYHQTPLHPDSQEYTAFITHEKKVTAIPAKTRLGLKEVEYVGHLISSTGTSLTEDKRLPVLDLPLPETENALLQFIGLVMS